MGIKISALPQNNLPYTGAEEIPLVQERETRAGTLSSFVNYLSGDFAFVNRTNNFTQSQIIAGDLTVTGEISATAFYASSAYFSVMDIKQYELSGFDVEGDVNLTGNLSAGGDLSVTGNLNTGGNLTVAGEISATAFYASSAYFSVIDIKQYELSGFDVTGDVNLTGNLSARGDLFVDGVGVIDTNSSNDALRITQRGNGKAIVVEDSANPDATSFFVDASGRVVVGGLSSIYGGQCEIYSNNAVGPWVALKHHANTADGSYIGFVKTRGANPESNDPVVSGDNLGTINFQGTDGASNRVSSYILSEADGTPSESLSSVPGRLTFGTTLSGLRQPSERMRITNEGNVGISTTAPNKKLSVAGSISATNNLTVDNAVGIGTDTPNEKLTVVGNISATQVIFANELDFGSPERPSFTGIKQALNSFLYVSPTLLYMRVNGSSSVILEVGQALAAPPITWTSNKVEAPAISGYRLTLPNGSVQAGSLTYTFSSYNDPNTYDINTLPVTDTQATSSWIVTVTDWNNVSNTATATANWRYRIYYGATSQASPTDADILASSVPSQGGTSVLATSRLSQGAKTITASNEYLYVAYPKRFGATTKLKIGGFDDTDLTLIEITSFTNAQGGTADYYVYRGNNLVTGSYSIEIV